MEKKKVISRKNLPTTIPLNFTLLTYLMMDYYMAPGWVWGVWIALMTLFWIGTVINIFVGEQIQDIFK